VRDPNNVGADMVYDNLGRNTQRTDTVSDVTKTEYATLVPLTYCIENEELERAEVPVLRDTPAANSPSGTIADSDTFTYDLASRMLTAVNGRYTNTVAYAYDNLLSTSSYSSSTIGNLSYTWDANKNKTSESITGVMSGYGFTSAGTSYDFEDRLVGYSRAATSGPAQLAQSWNLTSVGDWNSTTINGTVQNRTHGPTHELLTAGGQNVTHDVKGNMTSIPANLREADASTAMNLSWDFDNKMKSADIDANGTADVSFQYDALGRRVARTGTSGSWVFVQAGQQTIADYVIGNAPSASLYRYVYASYIDEPVVRKGTGTGGTIHYYHRNQQYSIYAVTTSAGAVTERYAYTAYGQPTVLNASANVISASAIGNRYSYTGREWDATVGLHHFRARWMSGVTGRFLGRDPIGYDDGPNLVSIVRARALAFMDFNGLRSISTLDPKEKAGLNGCNCEYIGVVNRESLPEGASGWTECDGNGNIVPVVLPVPTYPEWGDCEEKCGTTGCSLEHENHHIEQTKYVCPGMCLICGIKAGTGIGMTGPNCLNKSECWAYKIEEECLKKLQDAEDAKPTDQKKRCTRKRPDGTDASTTCGFFIKFYRQKIGLASQKYNCVNLGIDPVIK
jgi:RHS repeat-associated protein